MKFNVCQKNRFFVQNLVKTIIIKWRKTKKMTDQLFQATDPTARFCPNLKYRYCIASAVSSAFQKLTIHGNMNKKLAKARIRKF